MRRDCARVNKGALILAATDAAVLQAGLDVAPDATPLLYAAKAGNWQAMAAAGAAQQGAARRPAPITWTTWRSW